MKKRQKTRDKGSLTQRYGRCTIHPLSDRGVILLRKMARGIERKLHSQGAYAACVFLGAIYMRIALACKQARRTSLSTVS